MAAPATSRVFSRRFISGFRALGIGALIVLGIASAQGATWEPVPKEELESRQPIVDPEAGAEVLLRETFIDQRAKDRIFHEIHQRVKIFSPRGVESFSKISISYDADFELMDLAVRTIKPDGTIIELGPKEFFTREVFKSGKASEHEASFAPAGLEPGSIVEYRYHLRALQWHSYLPLFFQGDAPARIVRFKVVPTTGYQLQALNFNVKGQNMKRYPDGSYRFELKNVPKFADEEYSPPALNAQSAILLCYEENNENSASNPAEFWEDYGNLLHEYYRFDIEPSRLVRVTLAGLVSETDSDDQKLRKIYDYCRSKITNLDRDTTSLTREQRLKLKESKGAADTIKLGYGHSSDINFVFIALARAIGFDARVATANDRSFINFRYDTKEQVMANEVVAAVNRKGRWRFFDPGATYLPYGVLKPENSGTGALIAALEKADVIATPSETPETSQKRSTGIFQLQLDGTLEGDVTIEYSGYLDAEAKSQFDALTPVEREKRLIKDLQEYLKLAEATAFNIENPANPLEPLKIIYHLRIPEYADRTGSRLFFTPAVFQKNTPAVFTAPVRHHDLVFPYRWKMYDEIHIKPPDGYEFEEPSAPGSLSLGDLGRYETSVSLNRKTGELVYRRTFVLQALGVSKENYTTVRDAFDLIHERDGHTLTLKRKDLPASDGTTTTALP